MYECFYNRSGQPFAVKCIDKTFLSETEKTLVQQEIELIQQVGHPNIFVLVDIFDSDTLCHIVMELATGGDVWQSLTAQDYYSESEAKVLYLTCFWPLNNF